MCTTKGYTDHPKQHNKHTHTHTSTCTHAHIHTPLSAQWHANTSFSGLRCSPTTRSLVFRCTEPSGMNTTGTPGRVVMTNIVENKRQDVKAEGTLGAGREKRGEAEAENEGQNERTGQRFCQYLKRIDSVLSHLQRHWQCPIVPTRAILCQDIDTHIERL